MTYDPLICDDCYGEYSHLPWCRALNASAHHPSNLELTAEKEGGGDE